MSPECPTCGKLMRYLYASDAWVCPEAKWPLLLNPEHWVGNEVLQLPREAA